MTKDIWKERFQDINDFESVISRAMELWFASSFSIFRRKSKRSGSWTGWGIPEKNWKFSASDVHERQYWDDYMNAYEDMVVHTASPHAPWYVVPADNKWFTRVVVAAAIVETLEDLKLSYPKVDPATRKELQAARALLDGKKKA